MLQHIKVFFVFLLASIAINLVIFNALYNPKRIAIVDVQDIISDFIKNISNDNDMEKEKKIEQFVIKLNASIKQTAKENNLIIVPKQVIFAGEDMDITNEFRRMLESER